MSTGTHRLDRRIAVLRGKRHGAFDPDQYFLERALRTRAGRKVRLALRRNQPVLLLTPRWSEAQPFLDDVSIDIRLGRPSILSRTLSLKQMSERPINDAWRFILQGLIEFCHLHGEVGAAVVDRNGFRNHLAELLSRLKKGPRRALMVHGVEHLNTEVRSDLIELFEQYRIETPSEDRKLNMLFACSVDSPAFEIAGAARIVLADYAPIEAIEALVEYLGPVDKTRLNQAVQVIGGVPALLRALGNDGVSSGTLALGRSAIWRALGPLADEIRGALDIVASDDRLARRLEHVAQEGPVPRDEDEGDEDLVRAGLIQEVTWGRPNRVQVRAPVFAELALG